MSKLKQIDHAVAKLLNDYARLGWYFVPIYSMRGANCSCGKACKSAGKHPVNQKLGSRFLDGAVQGNEQALQHFIERGRNLALVTGPESGVIVLDVDDRNGGRESLARLLAQHGPMPETLRARSGSGQGVHYYFAHPVGEPIKKGNPGGGLDLQASGAYVLVAPSNHKSGQLYEWENWGTPLAPLPAWLISKKEPAALSFQEVTASMGTSPTRVLIPSGEGLRHRRLLQIAGVLHRQSVGSAPIRAALHAINETEFVEPYTEREVEQIANRTAKWGNDEKPVEGLEVAPGGYRLCNGEQLDKVRGRHGRILELGKAGVNDNHPFQLSASDPDHNTAVLRALAEFSEADAVVLHWNPVFQVNGENLKLHAHRPNVPVYLVCRKSSDLPPELQAAVQKTTQ